MARKFFVEYDENETFGRDRNRDRNGVKEQRRNARKLKQASATAWQNETEE